MIDDSIWSQFWSAFCLFIISNTHFFDYSQLDLDVHSIERLVARVSYSYVYQMGLFLCFPSNDVRSMRFIEEKNWIVYMIFYMFFYNRYSFLFISESKNVCEVKILSRIHIDSIDK